VSDLNPVQALPQEWVDWLRLNRERGCDPWELFQTARDAGFSVNEIQALLGVEIEKESSADGSEYWAAPPITNAQLYPEAERIQVAHAQMYVIPEFLGLEPCQALISCINQALVPSTVTHGPDDFRTSRTCHLNDVNPGFIRSVDQRLSALLGVDPAYSEPLQGQRYDQGQYFKLHTDAFALGSAEYQEHAALGGQRTWTVMVYLNTVECGGETRFPLLGQSVRPRQGMVLAWNNLLADGKPNPVTLHEALPVLQGEKYVITKWFRARLGRAG
jgi:prolyl 4-hydroxylase